MKRRRAISAFLFPGLPCLNPAVPKFRKYLKASLVSLPAPKHETDTFVHTASFLLSPDAEAGVALYLGYHHPYILLRTAYGNRSLRKRQIPRAQRSNCRGKGRSGAEGPNQFKERQQHIRSPGNNQQSRIALRSNGMFSIHAHQPPARSFTAGCGASPG